MLLEEVHVMLESSWVEIKEEIQWCKMKKEKLRKSISNWLRQRKKENG